MGAVVHIYIQTGQVYERKWYKDGKFNALIKCFIKHPGDHKLQVIEKTSTRPATYSECYRFSQKLKQEHGNTLQQLIIWNMDELKENSNFLK